MADFGLKYYAEMRSKHFGVLWRVEIAERGYTASAEEMTFDGDDPLKITWEKRGDEFYAPIKASEASINILCTQNFHYLSLFTSDPRQFRVSVYRGGALYWRGFVTADLYSESFTAPPYTVTIKAVDGFNLLSSYLFYDLMTIGVSGRKSLFELMSRSLELMELDMPISDWLDLYADGMNESLSPLTQTYIDLERLYYVYEKPTYRDILELCLLPFAGQIFQSSGALHIRRAISLYQTSRPVTFFEIGSELPQGIIATDNEATRLVAEPSVVVVTSAGRDIMENMWSRGIYVMGESTLDIVPALRRITVDVKNKSLDNIAGRLGFFDKEMWNDPYGFLDFTESGDSLCFCGDDAHQGESIYTAGREVRQCNYPIAWEFSIKTYHRQWSWGIYSPPSENYSVSVHYGVRLVAAGAIYYLTESGAWSSAETDIVSEVKTGAEQNIKIEIAGIPKDGTWQFYFRQTLIGKINYSDSDRIGSTSGHMENATFSAMNITIDAGEVYDKGLHLESLINPANNVEMNITLPVSDIPDVPNDHLLYALYFIDADGNPTRLWHTKGRNDYDTLVGHIVQGALRYKQLPSKRLAGDVFTSAHFDMNTVLCDDKYLKVAYSVNSIELSAVEDMSNCELTEMPGLIESDQPSEGDDCIKIVEMPFTVKRIIRCLNFLLVQSADRRLFVFDVISRSLREIYRSSHPFDIFPAEEGFVREENKTFYYCDHRGTVQQVMSIYPETYQGWATYRSGYFSLLVQGYTINRVDGSRSYYLYFQQPELRSAGEESVYHRGLNYVQFYGDLVHVDYTNGCLTICTSREAGFNDSRYHQISGFTKIGAGKHIVSISDKYMLINENGSLNLYRRTSITDHIFIARIGDVATYCDHTLAEIAFAGDSPTICDLHTYAHQYIGNTEASGESVLGLFYIYGDLYIVRERAIYKYVSPN